VIDAFVIISNSISLVIFVDWQFTWLVHLSGISLDLVTVS